MSISPSLKRVPNRTASQRSEQSGAFSSEKSTITACPQVANDNQCYGEYWGITPAQIRELLARLRADPSWDPKNNVYTLVNEYIKPWTQGKGVGYALLVNAEDPKEVNIMVSHAWSENAEEFFEALLRSTEEEDALFVCALSLYQVQDGAGPSIVEQLGTDPGDSPFHRVLSHIRRKGEAEGVKKWLFWPYAGFVIIALLVAALLCYTIPMMIFHCVPTSSVCVFPESDTQNERQVQWRDSPQAWLRALVDLSVFFLVLAACLAIVIWRHRVYRGAMIVVPNREDDLYSRLWCVYEIFVARTVGVPVWLANTLANAGSSSSKLAKCSSDADKRRIQEEIEEAYGPEAGYQVIDMSILITSRSAFLQVTLRLCLSGLLIAVLNVSTFALGQNPETMTSWTVIVAFNANIMGTLLVVLTAFHVFKRAEGQPLWRTIIIVTGANVVAGVLMIFGVADTWESAASVKCDRLPFLLGVMSIGLSGLLLATLVLFVAGRPRSLARVLLPGDRACGIVWLSLIGLSFFSLGAYQLDEWMTSGGGLGACNDVEEHEDRSKALFDDLSSLPWRQLGKCLASFSGMWPIYFAVIIQRWQRVQSAIKLGILAFVVMATLLTPITVFASDVASLYHFGYSVRCLFCLVVTLIVPWAFFGAAQQKWGLTVADRGVTRWQLAACLALFAGALLACRGDWKVIFGRPEKEDGD